MKVIYYVPLVLILCFSCIGTDIVEQELVPEMMRISQKVEALKVGETFMFGADYFNNTGELSGVPVMWSSTNSNIIAIDESGNATAISPGQTYIIAMYQSVKDSVLVESGEETIIPSDLRTGTFQGANNYTVSGDFSLADQSGQLLLQFNNNFRTSNGPGLHVYLSNQSSSVSGGIDLGELKSNQGSQQYDVPAEVNLSTYNFVIIYCKPFGVPFGYGQLNN
ncbi:MAG: DM13 domain-containing protein [Candidatus Cyclobacteriaceae bacterium M3_2C_046]